MNTGEIQPNMTARARRTCLIFTCIGFAGVLLLLWHEIQVLREFYVDTASIPPGTNIRPLGLALTLGITETGAAIFGIFFAIPPMFLAYKERSWTRLGLAVLLVFVSLVPLTFGNAAFHYIVAIRKLVLEE